MKKEKLYTKILFALYFLLLVWLILFKLRLSLSGLIGTRVINLIPLKGTTAANELLFNIIVFIPFGSYLSLLKPKWSLGKKLLITVGLSFIFEILQFIFAIGRTDITDLLSNSFGGFIGLLLFGLVNRLLKERAPRFINIAFSIVLFLLLLILFLSRAGIGLRINL